jgi:hypothetical protein
MLTDDQLKRFVTYKFSKECASEEDVKIKFVVKLFEALGHSVDNMQFEAKGSDILISYGDKYPSIVIEAKHCDKHLDYYEYLRKTAKYCKKHNALLAVLTNGREIWIFHPGWSNNRAFPDTCLSKIKNNELIKKKTILEKLLSRDALLSRGILVEYLHDIESKTIDSVEILDYVNYYGLIRGDQIIVCTNRKGSTGLILMCKKNRKSAKYGLSQKGFDFLKKLEHFSNSRYIADVDVIPLKRNKLKMWEELYDEELFPYWHPKKGPFEFNQPRKGIALCRTYKIDVAIVDMGSNLE